MFCLEVDTPVHWIIEFILMRFQQFDSFRISDMGKIGIDKGSQSFDQSFVIELLKMPFHQDNFPKHTDDEFHHILDDPHIVIQVCKSHFRFYHPEFSRMPCRVRFFCPERGAERINISPIRISIDRRPSDSLPFRRNPGKINLTIFCQRRIFRIQRCHPEHFTGAFAVGCRNQRGVNISKAAFVKKFMDGISADRPNPENRFKGIGPGAEMGNCPKKFQRMALFLQRIIRGGSAFQNNFSCMDFIGLLCLRCENYFTGHHNGRTDIIAGDLFIICNFISSKTTCKFLKQLPSFSSIKPRALESRMVLTQPADSNSLSCQMGKVPMQDCNLGTNHRKKPPILN